MKRVILFGILLLAMTAMVIAQVTDSTATVTYTFGQSFKDFLLTNLWTLAFVVLFFVDGWLAQTGKLKEGSVLALAWNWLMKFVRSKAQLRTKKAGFMNLEEFNRERAKSGGKPVAMIIILLLGTGLLANAQSPWSGFFRPVDKRTFATRLAETKAGASSVWLFRPAVEISAVQITYDKTDKQWKSNALSSAGMGIGYQHYIESNGVPYNNFGFNLLMLFNYVPTETSDAGVSVAGTVSALKFIDVGAGYNFQLKAPFILTGIKYSF